MQPVTCDNNYNNYNHSSTTSAVVASTSSRIYSDTSLKSSSDRIRDNPTNDLRPQQQLSQQLQQLLLQLQLQQYQQCNSCTDRIQSSAGWKNTSDRSKTMPSVTYISISCSSSLYNQLVETTPYIYIQFKYIKFINNIFNKTSPKTENNIVSASKDRGLH